MSTNTEKYGFMFMSQNAESYKNTSIQAKYFMELMRQKNLLAQEQAKEWAPDPEHGIVKEMLDTLFDAADKAGDAFHQDAINALIDCGTAGLSIVGVGVAHFSTSTKDIQMKIDDAEQLKGDLNGPNRVNPILEELDEDQPGAQLKPADKLSKEDNEYIRQKVNDWSTKGGKTFENYQKKMVGLEGELPDDVSKQNELNREAVEQAKASPSRKDILENLNDYIDDLKSERGRIEHQFNNWAQGIMNLLPPASKGLEVPQLNKKADDTTASQQGQSVGQVLQDAEKKQAQFFEQTAQQAEQDSQAADAAASSLGQIVQNRSGA
ncbi:MAG: hypothetical protein K1X28_05555 [Parachlamydiales bacterium]|nr:hypothetical protein [Parachlamydiales bacterium]